MKSAIDYLTGSIVSSRFSLMIYMIEKKFYYYLAFYYGEYYEIGLCLFSRIMLYVNRKTLLRMLVFFLR